METINGGYIMISRAVMDSDVYASPPHVRVIWLHLLLKATHKANKNFERGQCLVTLGGISEDLSWRRGFAREKFSKSKCEFSLKWLTKNGMITKRKTTRGLIITICNYDRYQDPRNYESNTKHSTHTTRSKQSSDTINKNVKEEEKEIDVATSEEATNSTTKQPKKEEPKWEHATIEVWKEFIDLFNKKMRTAYSYKYTNATNGARSKLNARLREGSTLDDIERAITNLRTIDFHKNSNFQHVTPEFVVRLDKLQKFLNMKVMRGNLNR